MTMFRLFFLCTVVSSTCLWPSPSRLFPASLLSLEYNGLDDEGTSQYSIVMNKSQAPPNIEYSIESIEPPIVDFDSSAVRLEIYHSGTLDWNDMITVTISAESPCWSGYSIGKSPYTLNVTSLVKLYHSYNDTLAPMSDPVWTTHGWRSQSHLVLYDFDSDPYFIDRQDVVGPCPGAWIVSRLKVLNSSEYTYWNYSTKNFDGVSEFVGGDMPRCHRADMGNVCVVRAHTRLEWPAECAHDVSIWQSVSQVARLTPTPRDTDYPPNFDASRRSPVPDGNDLRYDMCTSTVCSGNCTSSRVENDALATDGDIFIRQEQTVTDRSIETVCTFEVVGFLDNIWSPHIYMRKWYGYEWY